MMVGIECITNNCRRVRVHAAVLLRTSKRGEREIQRGVVAVEVRGGRRDGE